MITKLVRGNTAHIDSISLSKLKKQAKELKRSNNISHTEALELTAKKFGFDNWHQVVDGNKIFHETERCFKDGIFVVFHTKEALEVFDKKFLLTEDPLAEYIVRKAYYQFFSNLIDEEEMVPLKELYDKDELDELFEDDLFGKVFFRLNVIMPELDDEDVCYPLNTLLQHVSFQLPEMYIVKGKFIDNDYTYDMDWDHEPDDRYREEHWPENQTHIESGIFIDPNLPDDFDSIDNKLRSSTEIKHWWNVPFIRTVEGDGRVAYLVRMLDGGAWDRTTNHGGYDDLATAITVAKQLQSN